MDNTRCIPECSEFWTEQDARDHEAGIAMPCPSSACSPPDDSFTRLKDAYTKAYTENPLLPRSRYTEGLRLCP